MVEFDYSRDIVEWVDSKYEEMDRHKWFKLVNKKYKEMSHCKRVELFGSPVEAFCTDIEKVEPLGVIEPEANWNRQILSDVEEFLEDRPAIDTEDKAIGIHTTSREKVDSIMENGFDEGEGSTGTERDGSVFFWIHSVDTEGMLGGGAGGIIIVGADKDFVNVSSYMNASALLEWAIEPADYDKYHTVGYNKYVNCLKDNMRPSEEYTPDTIYNG